MLQGGTGGCCSYETARRISNIDIQDFSGQVLPVGILDAFMDSKGHVTPEEWAGYCSDHILLAQFPKYVYQAGETFRAKMAIRYYNPEKLENKILHWELKQQKRSFEKDPL